MFKPFSLHLFRGTLETVFLLFSDIEPVILFGMWAQDEFKFRVHKIVMWDTILKQNESRFATQDHFYSGIALTNRGREWVKLNDALVKQDISFHFYKTVNWVSLLKQRPLSNYPSGVLGGPRFCQDPIYSTLKTSARMGWLMTLMVIQDSNDWW